MKRDKLIPVGKVIGSQGNKGELRTKIYYKPREESFFPQKIFFILNEKESQSRVRSFRINKDFYILKLDTVDTIVQAEQFVGKDIYIPESELEALEEGYYYNYQVIECTVFTKDGNIVGTVRDIINIKDNDLLEIEREGRVVLIPFSEGICLEVDPEEKRIVIDPPDGLLDLNEI
ncbi:MAG: 16S rRNA processing protein RimM [Candidatus Aminicenantes bacterium]|nr:16S rRNA processing protein RimM [Candidatus Aminicenantes bacterium]